MKSGFVFAFIAFNLVANIALADSSSCRDTAVVDALSGMGVGGTATVTEISKQQALELITPIDTKVYRGYYGEMLGRSKKSDTAFKVTMNIVRPGIVEGAPEEKAQFEVVTLRKGDCTRKFMLIVSSKYER